MGNAQSNIRTPGEEDQLAQAHVDTRNHTQPEDQLLNHRASTHVSGRPQLPALIGSRRSLFSSARHSLLSESWRRESQRLANENNAPFDTLDDRPYEAENTSMLSSEHDTLHDFQSSRPQNWRHSTMSRLGSRLLPENVTRGMAEDREQMREEEQALSSDFSSHDAPSSSSLSNGRVAATSQDRFAINTHLRRRTTEARREDSRNSMRRFFTSTSTPQPVQIRDEDDDIHNDRLTSTDTGAAAHIHAPARSNTSAVPQIQSRPRSRLYRVRNSLSAPFSNLLSLERSSSSRRLHSPPSRPLRRHPPEDSDNLLSQPQSPDHRGNIADNTLHELDAVEPETRNMLSSSRITSGMSTIRRFPHGLRSRSTRLIRRGEHPPLSQVLQLAAAAIAAQLSGSSINANDGPGPGGEAFDGSIQNFVQTLQEAASAQAGQNIDLNATDGDLPPVNFMRVFQFPNDENGTPLAARPTDPSSAGYNEESGNENTDRSVTLVLVGVRSMPNFTEGHANENGTLGPSLDTLLSLPFLPPANMLRNGSSGALFRRSDTRTRTQARHNSMTNFSFPQQYESQRHARGRNSGATRTSMENGLLTPMSESPPGPNPPPSTPADIRSGHATPIRRPSSASAVHNPGLPDLEENLDMRDTSLPPESAFHAARQRQRSESEVARRPELASGNPRRNGVVEPDRPAGGAGRSWLIYVVGTNVSPDHPAFTMPSLFTDNPSYEDMQMLSTLLGPVKPPVASHDDVEAAGGLYRVLSRGGVLLAEAVSTTASEHAITISVGDRCLVCLCDYEPNDFVRQIDSCHHVYHRECIDEWLTTGRNSCPMCRGQGVKESAAETSATSGSRPEQAEHTS